MTRIRRTSRSKSETDPLQDARVAYAAAETVRTAQAVGLVRETPDPTALTFPAVKQAGGVTRIDAPSAALLPAGAAGHRVDGGLRPGPPRDGRTIVLYGRRPALVGWRASYEARPADDLLARVRYVE